MKLVRNAKAVLKNPRLLGEFLTWKSRCIWTGGRPIREVHGVRVGGFSSFSEYHSSIDHLTPREASFISELSLGGGDIIDVGANIGIVSLVLARRYPDKVVHAIEPAPSTHTTLATNAALNGASILCHQLAISDSCGTIAFNADPKSRATASIASPSDPYSFDVKCRTLDVFASEHGIQKVAFLKVDVEGFEALVFRGASRILREVRPSIIWFEIVPSISLDAGFQPAEAVDILIAAGYDCYRFTKNGLEPAGPRNAEKEVSANWIATPRGRGAVSHKWISQISFQRATEIRAFRENEDSID